ncbi:MAG TPA: ATP-dependent metallopeptidase FtsH/Yme1/Tma family protein [Clostridia bacterium]|nr:ATP-dependent metallopeptidase FtsH/Yme1/Tma family protein [Clostridia bacterium]
MSKKHRIVIAIVAALLLFATYGVWQNRRPTPKKISYNEFLHEVKAKRVEKVFLNGGASIRGTFKGDIKFITDNPRKEGLKEELLREDIIVDEMEGREVINQILGYAVMAGLLIFSMVYITKKAPQTKGRTSKVSGMNIKPEESVKVKFSNIAGNEEALHSVEELIDFINNPGKYSQYGARLPRGVILYGPPGTGKTLLAKAIAGEAGVPFYAVSGSDFVQVYVGVGASRIRELFKMARQVGKCVIFIDEIDALGKKRDGGLEGGGNDERDQTLNALLAEMSGFNENEGIVVVAATNRLDTLDEALLRPGRFDRHIEIGLPDVKARLKILGLHSRNKPIGDEVNLEKLAQQTVYFSGAQLENLMNEAAILAAKKGNGVIEHEDIEVAFYTVVAGFEKKDRSSISEIDRKITAYHESGHALITKLVAPENRVSKVTIIPSTKGAGGFSMNIPPDRMYSKKRDMENNIKIMLAGRCAEEIIFGKENITTGASNDLEKATKVLVDMVRRFGMTDSSGLLNYDVLYENGIRDVQDNFLDEAKDILDNLYSGVRDLLMEHKPLLEAIALKLLEEETLEEEQLDYLVQKAG